MLQSHTVYSNVSKGVLAKSKDLIAAFGTDDHSKICLEVSKEPSALTSKVYNNNNNNNNSNNIIFFYLFFCFCLRRQILQKGELQVAGKERESLLSSQFRDIATIVMHKTYNPETQRPYTISMIERLMREIHFAVDPHSTSKKQVSNPISLNNSIRQSSHLFYCSNDIILMTIQVIKVLLVFIYNTGSGVNSRASKALPYKTVSVENTSYCS